MRTLSHALIALALVVAGCSSEGSATEATDAPSAWLTASTTNPPTTEAPTTTVQTPPTLDFLWENGTATALLGDTTGTWSNRVELADIDGDGDVDLLFADGGDYNSPGTPVTNQAWLNDGAGVFTDASLAVFGPEPDLTRAMKARDVTGDGIVDIIVGNTYQTQSRLLVGTGDGAFEDATSTNLPVTELTVGDIELGDVDADGDLDLVIADWGDGHPVLGGGITRLWLNDGSGVFTDATTVQMPESIVKWSWELELIDIDNDFDLDIAVSCKACEGSFLFENDGVGTFTDVSDRMPQYSNNYEFEAADFDGDGYVDLLTLNDGPSFSNHVFGSDGISGFNDITAATHPDRLTVDDNTIAIVDFDSDGDADALVGHFGPRDRLMVNDGTGTFSLKMDVLGGDLIVALGTAVADLNGDHRIDVVQAGGEAGEMEERVFFGTLVEPDTAPPIIGMPTIIDGVVHIRLHDNKSPLMPHDFASVSLSGPGGEAAMKWYGEYLWRAEVTAGGEYSVCATDAAGNEACSDSFGAG